MYTGLRGLSLSYVHNTVRPSHLVPVTNSKTLSVCQVRSYMHNFKCLRDLIHEKVGCIDFDAKDIYWVDE